MDGGANGMGRGLMTIPKAEEDKDAARSIRTIVPGDSDGESDSKRGAGGEGMRGPETPEVRTRAVEERTIVDDSHLDSLALQLENITGFSKLLAFGTPSRRTRFDS